MSILKVGSRNLQHLQHRVKPCQGFLDPRPIKAAGVGLGAGALYCQWSLKCSVFEIFREILRLFWNLDFPPSDDMPQVWQTEIGPFPLPLPPPPHHNRKKIIKCLKVWRNTVCHIWEILHEKTMIPLPPPTNHNRKKINKSHKSLLKILCQAITFTQLKQYKFHNLLQISKHRPPFDTSYGK